MNMYPTELHKISESQLNRLIELMGDHENLMAETGLKFSIDPGEIVFKNTWVKLEKLKELKAQMNGHDEE